jgi:DNA segregation ATPase FtsK/SpoIIIE, S-DNA-T family
MLSSLRLPVHVNSDKPSKIKRTLKSFKIECTKIVLTEGDYFDIYDIELRPGTRSSTVDRALTDIGLALKSHSCPRGYPVLSSGVYRIEVQQKELKSISFDRAYSPAEDMYMPVALGVNADGSEFCIDLHKLPNLLIGGIPGSGKSVLLHSIIFSLLKCSSDLYLVDPKMVEFNLYEGLQGVKTIVNDIEGTYDVISQVTEIMENRFKLLKSKRARNVQDYNNKVSAKKRLNPVVIVIDEWADIILQDKKVQEPLCRIAQKGRAAGVSIVLATQRPSAKVISGLIKASFSGRIGLRVVSNVDSRVVLDQGGAEKIISVGSGLYLDQSMSEAKIFRAPYIEEVEAELNALGIPKQKSSFWSLFS